MCHDRVTVTLGEVDEAMSNKDIEKKKRETYYLDKVKSLYDEFPSGELTSCE